MADSNARLALVTGAGQGIGAAVTGQLVSEGMRVIAMEKRVDLLDGLVAKFGDKVIPSELDLCEMTSISGVVSELVQEHGPVTALVNNAGVWPGSPIVDMDDKTWLPAEMLFVPVRTMQATMRPRLLWWRSPERPQGNLRETISGSIRCVRESLVRLETAQRKNRCSRPHTRNKSRWIVTESRKRLPG